MESLEFGIIQSQHVVPKIFVSQPGRGGFQADGSQEIGQCEGDELCFSISYWATPSWISVPGTPLALSWTINIAEQGLHTFHMMYICSPHCYLWHFQGVNTLGQSNQPEKHIPSFSNWFQLYYLCLNSSNNFMSITL